MTITLIPCGATEWRDEERLLGRVELPMSPEGQALCAFWAKGLANSGLRVLLHPKDELCTNTARRIARALGLRHKSNAALDEVNLGLWTGLTQDQLRTRYESAYEEFSQAPLNVGPPEGESLHEAYERLRTAVEKILRQHANDNVAIVARPFALALIRYILSDSDLSSLWEALDEGREPRVIAAPRLRPE